MHGPFQYVGKLSARYYTVKDQLGREWDTAFNDAITYSQARGIAKYRVTDVLMPTHVSAKQEAAVHERQKFKCKAKSKSVIGRP